MHTCLEELCVHMIYHVVVKHPHSQESVIVAVYHVNELR